MNLNVLSTLTNVAIRGFKRPLNIVESRVLLMSLLTENPNRTKSLFATKK